VGVPAPGSGGAAAASGSFAKNVKMVAFDAASGTASRIDPGKGGATFTDSPNYLPPNSIAKATVVVGVDATTNTRSQSDPLPVLLRITGPARSVYDDGKLYATSVQGCMVNGAAYGDLSSEKVYVKLQRMTCPQPGGRFAVSEVKGFIAFGGKVGVRGRVVSREGSLVGQAFLAGLAGGFGRGFAANTNSVFSGANVSVDGKREELSTTDILKGGIGEGVSTAGDQVSQYLIERAEQYQPVIEMPTGASVEVVFLDGTFIRN
jgi:conjugal transfer pilus assembly protein TraB